MCILTLLRSGRVSATGPGDEHTPPPSQSFNHSFKFNGKTNCVSSFSWQKKETKAKIIFSFLYYATTHKKTN